MADLLDEIERHGSALVVLRYGRPSAMLVPFAENGQAPKLPRLVDLTLGEATSSSDDDLSDEEIAELGLADVHRRVLLSIATCTALLWKPSQCPMPARESLRTLGRLDILGLIDHGPGASYHLTTRGEAVVRRLNSER